MEVKFLSPLDQFTGSVRLLDGLLSCLRDADFTNLVWAVAFAKSGPLLRLKPALDDWRQRGGKSDVIVGVDHDMTSKEALALALNTFDSVSVVHTRAHATFHPKFYLFFGKSRARCFIGSHNLTVGGTETNLEGGLELTLSLPEEANAFSSALSFGRSLMPGNCDLSIKLDPERLETLVRHRLVCEESARNSFQRKGRHITGEGESLFKWVPPKPPRALPKQLFTKNLQRLRKLPVHKRASSPAISAPPQALVIQIVPHHNGEVFLSKIAVNQNPDFFGFPFTGKTVPKKPGNPSYPQRMPDPLVDISVFDKTGSVVTSRQEYPLNMVFYERKSEIRITFSPDLKTKIRPFALMVMRMWDGADYKIEVYNPGGVHYQQLLASCNQEMPSGGASTSRKMGWI